MAMHAYGVRPAFRGMRTMQTTKPGECANGGLSQSLTESFAAGLLCAALVEAGRDPDVGLPGVVERFQSFKIPAPFQDESTGGEDANETKGVNALECQCIDGGGGGVRGSSLEA